MKKIKKSLIIVGLNYIVLSILSIVFTLKVDFSILGMGGLLIGFILLIASLPLHKILYFGGRGMVGTQSPQIPNDEHLHHKIHQQYEKEERAGRSQDRYQQDVLTIAGCIIIVIAVFLV